MANNYGKVIDERHANFCTAGNAQARRLVSEGVGSNPDAGKYFFSDEI